MILEVRYFNREDEQWPPTRGNHTDPKAIERVNKLPEEVREHVWTNDPCWSYVTDGWRDLVVRLHNTLVKVAPDYRVDQIKEKFGGLRFYTNIGYDEDSIPHMIISHFENLSFQVCDICGERGECGRVGGGYIATRCEKHRDQIERT